MPLRSRLRSLSESTSEIHSGRLQKILDAHPEAIPMEQATPRDRVVLVGEVRRSRVVPGVDGAAHLEVTISDGTGSVEVRFLGRRHLPGVDPGRCIRVSGRGMPTHWSGRLRFTNPTYDLL